MGSSLISKHSCMKIFSNTSSTYSGWYIFFISSFYESEISGRKIGEGILFSGRSSDEEDFEGEALLRLDKLLLFEIGFFLKVLLQSISFSAFVRIFRAEWTPFFRRLLTLDVF